MKMFLLTLTYTLACVAASIQEVENVEVQGFGNSHLALDNIERSLTINWKNFFSSSKTEIVPFNSIQDFYKRTGTESEYMLVYRVGGATKERKLHSKKGADEEQKMNWDIFARITEELYKDYKHFVARNDMALARTKSLRFEENHISWEITPEQADDACISPEKFNFDVSEYDVLEFSSSELQWPPSLGAHSYHSRSQYRLLHTSGQEYFFQYLNDGNEDKIFELMNEITFAVLTKRDHAEHFKQCTDFCIEARASGMPVNQITFENFCFNLEERCKIDRACIKRQISEYNRLPENRCFPMKPFAIQGERYGRYHVYTCDWKNLSPGQRKWYEARTKNPPSAFRNPTPALKGWKKHPAIFDKAKLKAFGADYFENVNPLARRLKKLKLPRKRRGSVVSRRRVPTMKRVKSTPTGRKHDSAPCA